MEHSTGRTLELGSRKKCLEAVQRFGCQTPAFRAPSGRLSSLKLATAIIDFAKENAVTGKLLIKWSWVRVPAGSP
jgi:hypothetical protein